MAMKLELSLIKKISQMIHEAEQTVDLTWINPANPRLRRPSEECNQLARKIYELIKYAT